MDPSEQVLLFEITLFRGDGVNVRGHLSHAQCHFWESSYFPLPIGRQSWTRACVDERTATRIREPKSGPTIATVHRSKE